MDPIKILRGMYQKYSFEKQSSPSYVNMFTKTTSETVLAYAKNKQLYTASKQEDVGDNKRSIQEELELTGSPLKLDLSLHTILDDTLITDEPTLWSKDEACHAPITIEKAREVANSYNKILRGTPEAEVTPLWIVCSPDTINKPLLLTIQSDNSHFARGIVSYESSYTFGEVDMDEIIHKYAETEGITDELVKICVDCKYLLSGISYGPRATDELLNAPHSGMTELQCEWPEKTMVTPFISCKVNLVQEVIVGHLTNPCNALWKSVAALHNINQILVDMTAAGYASVNLETAIIRNPIAGSKKLNNLKRLNNLLNETETYAYTAEYPTGGCVCVTEDTTSLNQCLGTLCKSGSSNDFTYKLWDILRDCETAEELITLLIQALKFILTGQVRPFIDANNKTYLSKLVLKLSRGHSQSSKVLQNLRSSPPQALSLVAQVGVEKTQWEYTKIMSLLQHSFFIAGIWSSDARSQETIEQINQTIQDMTMGGDFTLNPFESISTAETSIRLDCESFVGDDPNELTVDDFASLKKHGLVAEKKDVNEVPLIADEIDISPWKNLLMKFAQVHVCLEHLFRAETFLRADFASLKPLASKLLEYYVSDKSPIKTVGQLVSDPVQKISMPIANIVVQDHLKKPALWYRVEITCKENTEDLGLKRECKQVYIYSQLAVMPPPVWQLLEPSTDEVAEVTTMEDELKYHCLKYTFIRNKIVNNIRIL